MYLRTGHAPVGQLSLAAARDVFTNVSGSSVTEASFGSCNSAGNAAGRDSELDVSELQRARCPERTTGAAVGFQSPACARRTTEAHRRRNTT